MKNFTLVFIVLLVILGLYIRLVRLGDFGSFFAGDEGIQLLVADHMIRYGDFRLDGEISSLDAKGDYIIHNSPIGYYLYGIFYFLSGATPEGYALSYLLLNLTQALLLFWAASYLLHGGARVLVFIVALFSPLSLTLSSRPSQPANAIFFDTLAILLFAIFVRSRRENFFLASVVMTIFATQLYPPMYVLLFPKLLILGFFIYKRKIQIHVSKAFVWTLIAIIFIYLPLFLQEYVFQGLNSQVVTKFFAENNNTFLTNIRLDELFFRVYTIINTTVHFISPYKISFFIISIGVVALLLILRLKQLQAAFSTAWILGVVIGFSILIVSLVLLDTHLLVQRAYLFILFPYLCLLLGSLLSWVSTRVTVVLSTAYVIIVVLLLRTSLLHINKAAFQETRQIAHEIIMEAQSLETDLDKIDLVVISPVDKFSWDAGVYWYELERLAGRRLSRIDMSSSKARRLSVQPIKTVYLICHRISPSVVEVGCLGEFFKYDQGYKTTFTIVSSKRFDQSALYVLLTN